MILIQYSIKYHSYLIQRYYPMDQQYTIKNVSLGQVQLLLDVWRECAGWQSAINDADNFYTADPNGFFIGYLGDKPIAYICAFKYETNHGFIGLYIVLPEYRKKGYGLKIFNRAMEYLGNRNIGLDGVIAQVPNYEKSGFKVCHWLPQYIFPGSNEIIDDENIRLLNQIPFEQVNQYQKSCILVHNDEFTKKWISQPGLSIGYVQKGSLRGYCVLRVGKKFSKAGPLLADTPQIANKLLQRIKQEVGAEGKFVLGIWGANKMAVEMIKQNKGQLLLDCKRMYTRELPDQLNNEKIFGTNSCQIG